MQPQGNNPQSPQEQTDGSSTQTEPSPSTQQMTADLIASKSPEEMLAKSQELINSSKVSASGMAPSNSKILQPEGKTLTGQPLSWSSKLHFSLGASYFLPFEIVKELEGVKWQCPSCGSSNTYTMRRSRPQKWWFYCSKCHTHPRINSRDGLQICSDLGVA